MANILVLGVGPLPFEIGERLHAPGIRTWQIATALARRRHFVTLCVIEFGDFQGDKYAGKPMAVRQDVGQNTSLVRLKYHPDETAASIRTLHTATRFAAVVSTTDIMNAVTADLELNIPIWLDYNGDPFAEKQLQARLYQHDGSLLPQWQLYLKGLLHGDRFSVCGEPQMHALIGQLAFAGRLTGSNSGEKLVQVLPNCSRVMSERTPRRTVPLKGNKIPATAFLVLWTGGYNTWCDPETLFHGLEKAMQTNQSIFYATTGGTLEGHDNKSFEIFQNLVEQSPLRDRFIFLGWVATDEVASFYEQADLAVYNDRYSVEGELGTRTRLVDWMQYNIPIACTNLCELTNQLAEQNLISTFEIGDPDSMAAVILECAAHPEAARKRAEAASLWFDTNYGELEMLSPLLDWAQSPEFALDRKEVTDQPAAQMAWLSGLSRLQMETQPNHPSRPAPGKKLTSSPPPPSDGKQSLSSKFKGFFGRKS